MFACRFIDNKFVFQVSYEERQRAKMLGAFWDSDKKIWYKNFEMVSAEHDTIDKVVRMLASAGFELPKTDEQIVCDMLSGTSKDSIENAKRDYSAPQPDGVAINLFPYQKAGVKFLDTLDCAILADDMGLGKTPQSMSWARHKTPCLVVCPASLKENWNREISKFLPGKSVCVLHSSFQNYNVNGKKYRVPADSPGACTDFIVTNYEMLDKWMPWIFEQDIQAIIVDEAHMIKNMTADRTKNCLKLSQIAKNRLVVTGTPILNRPMELFSLLNFVGKLKKTDYMWFLKRFCEVEERTYPIFKDKQVVRDKFGRVKLRKSLKIIGAKNSKELRGMISPYFLRRTKDEVLTDLPPKVYLNRFVALDNRDEYDYANSNILDYLSKTDGRARAESAQKAIFLSKLSKLRQISANGKIKQVKQILNELRDNGKKAIIFSNFVDVLKNLHTELGEESVLYTGENNNQHAIDDFQNSDDCLWFLTTIKKGGVGLNLTRGDVVIFIDFPWTPGEKFQAEDRAHRYGQKNTVNVIHVIAEDTIDDMILDALSTKQKIISQIVDGVEVDQDEDITELLGNMLISKFSKQFDKNT